jgi:hypothetical protein
MVHELLSIIFHFAAAAEEPVIIAFPPRCSIFQKALA